MYDFLASSHNLESANLHTLVDCRRPTSDKPMVMFGLLVVTFTCAAIILMHVHVAPVSNMAVLSWFGGWYAKLHHWYNLFILLPVNLFTPT